VALRSISICIGKNPATAPTYIIHIYPRLRRTRLPRRHLTVPVVPTRIGPRAPRRQRVARRSGSKLGGGRDPPDPENGTAALDAARAAADQGKPKWDLGTPPDSSPDPAAQDDVLDELIARCARRLIGALPPRGSALVFRRTDDAWTVDTISLATAQRYPTQGRA
jgi:hypothetical protein